MKNNFKLTFSDVFMWMGILAVIAGIVYVNIDRKDPEVYWATGISCVVILALFGIHHLLKMYKSKKQ